jgi:hypothetical protein
MTYNFDLGETRNGIFFRMGLDSQIGDLLTGKSRLPDSPAKGVHSFIFARESPLCGAFRTRRGRRDRCLPKGEMSSSSVNRFTCGAHGVSYQYQTGPAFSGRDLEAAMTAITRVLSLAFASTLKGDGSLTTIGIFCGLGLLASLLLMATYGLDLSAGFF